MVTFEEFKKLDIITAKVDNVREHPNADKLLVLKVDTGGAKKEIVAGIKRYYSKEELIGKDIVMVNNLEPATIRGVQSNGMLLAVQDEDRITILMPERPTKAGSKVR